MFVLTEEGVASVKKEIKASFEIMRAACIRHGFASKDDKTEPPTVLDIQMDINIKEIKNGKYKADWPCTKNQTFTVVMYEGIHFADEKDIERKKAEADGQMSVNDMLDILKHYAPLKKVSLIVNGSRYPLKKMDSVYEFGGTVYIAAEEAENNITNDIACCQPAPSVKPVESVPMTQKEKREAYRKKISDTIQYALDNKMDSFEFMGDFNYNSLRSIAQEEANRIVNKSISRMVRNELTETEYKELRNFINNWQYSDRSEYISIKQHKEQDRIHVYCQISENMLNLSIQPIIDKAKADKERADRLRMERPKK